MTLPPWPHHEQDEIDAVVEILRTGRTNQWTGDTVRQFEAACEDWFGLTHALAVANGTVAIELALRGLEIGPGDDVLVSSRSFVASATMPLLVGAMPVFADVSIEHGNVTVETLEAARTPATRCAIVVHLCGWPCDMSKIMAWANQHGISVIEDCAQAHGAQVSGHSVGSFGQASAFSFCQDKIMTTGGEGGLVAFRDQAAADRAWAWRDHGKIRAEAMSNPTAFSSFRWLAAGPGTNLRMTAMQAAIGLVQLEKLADWQTRRAANAAVLRTAFDSCRGLHVPWPDGDCKHAWYQLTCLVDDELIIGRDSLLKPLREAGWPVRSGACPELYLERVFANHRPATSLPVAAELGRRSLTFPVHPTCDHDDMTQMATALTRRINCPPATN